MAESNSEPLSLSDQVFEGMVRLFWGARRYSQALQKAYEVTTAQLSALRLLERLGPVSQSQLSARLFVRGSTLSGILDRLQRRGWIERQRSEEDRRQVHVSLTAAGQEKLASIPRGRSKFGALRQLVRDLPEAEARQFLATLNRMVDQLESDSLPESDDSTASPAALSSGESR